MRFLWLLVLGAVVDALWVLLLLVMRLLLVVLLLAMVLDVMLGQLATSSKV